MNQKKPIKMLAILNSINTVLGMLFPLITFPYVTRVLGTENFGKVNFCSAVVSYFAIVAALGVYTYAVREGAIYSEDRLTFSCFASEVFSINVISTVIAYFLLFFVVLFVQYFQKYCILLLTQSITMIFTTIGVSWLYVVYEDYIYIVVRNILFQLLSMVLLFVLVRRSEDYVLYALITVISSGGSSLFNLFHSKKYVDLKLTFSRKCLAHLKSIFFMFASTVASTIYVNSDTIILGFMWDDSPVGIYSVSVKIYSILKTFVNAIYGVALSRITLAFSKGNDREATSIIDEMITISVFLMAPIIVGINILCGETVLFVGGEEYMDATVSLRVLMIAFFFSIFASLFSTLVLLPKKQEKLIMEASFISGLINIFLNLFFIREFKQNGAAITTVIAEIVVCLIFYFKSKKYVLFKCDYKELLKIIFSALVMIPISFWIKMYINNVGIRTIATIGSCAVTYGASLYVVKSRTFIALYRRATEKLKSIVKKSDS